MNKVKILFSSITLSTLPPLFFFNFLYYTDAGSLFFLLLMYLFHIKNQPWVASLFGFLSLLFRQTNIIWCFLLAAHASLKVSQLFYMLLTRHTSFYLILLFIFPDFINGHRKVQT